MKAAGLIAIAAGLVFSGGAYAAEQAITLDQLEPTGKKELCLKRKNLKGLLFLGDDTYLFASGDTLYTSKTQSRCSDPGERKISLVTQGSLICRNDLIAFLEIPGKRPETCALGEFYEVKLKTPPAE